MPVRRLLILFSTLCLLAGCGTVAANYPPATTPEPDLPATHSSNLGETPLVWREPEQLHGFLANWEAPESRAESFRNLAVSRNDNNARIASDLLFAAAQKGLASIVLHMFFAPDIPSFTLKTGDLVIEFEDGTQVRDEGILAGGSIGRPLVSWDQPIVMPDKRSGRGKMQFVIAFAPRRYLDRRVVRIARAETPAP